MRIMGGELWGKYLYSSTYVFLFLVLLDLELSSAGWVKCGWIASVQCAFILGYYLVVLKERSELF
jgi:hypothetical protein